MDKIISFFTENWVAIGVILMGVQMILKGVRDAIDKTPETDDNWFERIMTITSKAIGYVLAGKRPQ